MIMRIPSIKLLERECTRTSLDTSLLLCSPNSTSIALWKDFFATIFSSWVVPLVPRNFCANAIYVSCRVVVCHVHDDLQVPSATVISYLPSHPRKFSWPAQPPALEFYLYQRDRTNVHQQEKKSTVWSAVTLPLQVIYRCKCRWHRLQFAVRHKILLF